MNIPMRGKTPKGEDIELNIQSPKRCLELAHYHMSKIANERRRNIKY